ncbi:hypothetical protein [Nakamurella leprariae]|uniref:Uncharacterized protein n=1 Tax=Nakamurella leprariae TaxID=2803911 RepID=A0A938YBT1_9ACTN|nr:hypothetical protein [Nakamurella leprariae]MBM9469605.1 hypothetical protein [Nakamurella leprariae]
MTEQPEPTVPGSPEPGESVVLRELAGIPAEIAALDDVDLHGHPAVYRRLHEQLTSALADADPGSDPAVGDDRSGRPAAGPQPGRPGGFRPGPPRGR